MKTSPCKFCGHPIPYDPIPDCPSIVPKVCGSCSSSLGFDEDRAAEKAELDKKEAIWASICPAAYRLVSEGGITDLTRLKPLEWPEPDQERPGLLIAGKSGLGKTRWAWRALRGEYDAGRAILAFTPRGFEAAYRDADGQYKLKAFLDECSKVGCLFLDDLGKASWSPNTLETFYDIVEQRSSNLLPIYVTTNFNGDALAAQLKMDEGILEPLLRRLRENCRCISA